MRKQVVAGEAKRAAAGIERQLAKLADEIARIRREVTLPINAEIEVIPNKITEHGKQAAEEAQAFGGK